SCYFYFFFFSSRRRHTRFSRDWSSDVCSSDLSSSTASREWVDRLLNNAEESLKPLITRLAVEELRADAGDEERYGAAMLAALEAIAADRAIAELKSRLQRLNPVEAREEYNRLFGELVALEQHRRVLRERAAGSP